MFLLKADASTRLSYLIRTATALKCCNEDAIYKNKAGLIQKFKGRGKSSSAALITASQSAVQWMPATLSLVSLHQPAVTRGAANKNE